MSSNRRPQKWLAVAAFAAAFWLTLRVVAAPVPPPPQPSATPDSSQESSAYEEIRDPALERLIADLAASARRTRH